MIVSEGVSNLFTHPAKVKLVTVNCVGVMGKGIALEAKVRYPNILRNYKANCNSGALKPGGILPYYITPSEIILLVATKNHWSQDSKLEWIEAILVKLVANINKLNGSAIAVPPLGCGNGGLDYPTQVKSLLYKYLEPLTNEVHICL